MTNSASVAPILIFGYGNPSRGDDALGPLVLKNITRRDDVELLTDFQLQIEHSLDMLGRELILFIDASVASSPPLEFRQLENIAPKAAPAYTTHQLTPNQLLTISLGIHQQPAPPPYLLSIRGEHFELGAGLSGEAETNLQMAIEWVERLLSDANVNRWQRLLKVSATLAA